MMTRGGTTIMTLGTTTMMTKYTTHPQPHKQQLIGWNDDEVHNSTPDHHHKPLLVGWKQVLHEVMYKRARRCDQDRDEEQGPRQGEMRQVGWQQG